MAKKKNRTAASRRAERSEHPNTPGAVAGVYPISTGEAELVPDGYHADGWLLLVNGGAVFACDSGAAAHARF